MSKTVINDDRAETFVATGSRDTFVFTRQSSIVAELGAIREASSGARNRFELHGFYTSDAATVTIVNDNTSVLVGEHARLSGGIGLSLDGEGSSAVNHGKILSVGLGVAAFATDVDVANFGLITASVGMTLTIGSRLENREGGVIRGVESGLEIRQPADTASTVVNRGLIEGPLAIDGSFGRDRIVNFGTIRGEINLGGDDDVFISRGGRSAAGIVGSDGADLLITDSAKVRLSEIEGDFKRDEVRASVSYTLDSFVENLTLTGTRNISGHGNDGQNIILGNSGNNILSGGGAIDLLDGGRGNDRLTGGVGSDFFDFDRGDGRDVITDFTDEGADEDDFINFSFIKDPADFDKILAHASQRDDGVLIAFGKDSVLVKGWAIEDVTVGDFGF